MVSRGAAGATPSSALGPHCLLPSPPQRGQGHMPRSQGERPWASESCRTQQTDGWEPGPGGHTRHLVNVCAFGLHPPTSDHYLPSTSAAIDEFGLCPRELSSQGHTLGPCPHQGSPIADYRSYTPPCCPTKPLSLPSLWRPYRFHSPGHLAFGSSFLTLRPD